ncbi:hypothetical protein [Gracilimonas amylolytica]|uniref:hypothetical protein n=1 Tax=Gracilimonas amylolytica TaxID=1749045 RepID=UPI000CD9D403|nr:hypothetical protein [Gracilimonas amylolytica]
MSGEEFVLAMIGILGGLGFAGFIFWNIFSIIKQWIHRKSGNSQLDPQFFRALGEFKKNTERKISELEAKINELEEERYRVGEGEHESMGDIEIEEEEIRSSSKQDRDNSNLRNMLNE